MPVDSAFDREIDPVSCMLYPANVTEPVIQCGKRQGLVCLQAYGVMLGAITVGIPFIFWLCLRRALKDDPIAVRLMWWREHREQLRLILNAPRSFVVLIIYLIGFGRVVIKYIFSGICRNDEFTVTKDKYVLAGMAFNSVFVPFLKCVYEVTFVTRRDNPDIGFSRAEEWRRRLTYPAMDLFLVLTPILGALMFPQGHQSDEEQGRTCLRGWGCEFHDYMPGLVALGSVIWAAIIVVFGGVVYWMGRKGGQTRHFVHWVFLVVMPVWLTWFGWCSFKLVMAKSSNYRQLNYFATFTMAKLKDPRSFSFVPCFAFVNALLDILCFSIIIIVWRMTAPPSERTTVGRARYVAPKAVGPPAYNSPLQRARERGGADSGSPLAEAKRLASPTKALSPKVHPFPV